MQRSKCNLLRTTCCLSFPQIHQLFMDILSSIFTTILLHSLFVMVFYQYNILLSFLFSSKYLSILSTLYYFLTNLALQILLHYYSLYKQFLALIFSIKIKFRITNLWKITTEILIKTILNLQTNIKRLKLIVFISRNTQSPHPCSEV